MEEKSKTRTPALNPLTFKQLVTSDTLLANKTERDARLYEVKILKLLLPCYGMLRKEVEVYFDGRTKNPYDVIIGGARGELQRIWVRKVKGVTIGKLVKEPLTTSAFANFKEIVNQYWYPIGMVFPVLSYGDWIMHTLGCPVDKGRGMARIAVAAVTEGVPDLVIESLGQFITSRKGMEQWLMQ